MNKKNNHYSYGLIFPWLFTKHWFWFVDPHDVENAAMVNFFSYNNIEKEGFYKKEGLTSIIDLNKNLDELWENVRKKYTRNLITKGESHGISIKQDKNFNQFNLIYKNFRSAKNLSMDNISIFKDGILFSAYLDGKMIAGHLFAGDGNSIRSLVAASLRLGEGDQHQKRIIGMANRMLIWEAIKYSKNNGYKVFDLGGISPDSNKEELRNLAEFKESFGGTRKQCFYYHKVYSKILRFWMKLRGFKNL